MAARRRVPREREIGERAEDTLAAALAEHPPGVASAPGTTDLTAPAFLAGAVAGRRRAALRELDGASWPTSPRHERATRSPRQHSGRSTGCASDRARTWTSEVLQSSQGVYERRR
ncbi:hypothetical protein ACICHK_39830 [Streptomyces sp. AHU1]|uniref:hypothetical protein n=1 Tax=Streptomyces sp. AHU1 TaxID=3377215 RepID=UPI003877E61F